MRLSFLVVPMLVSGALVRLLGCWSSVGFCGELSRYWVILYSKSIRPSCAFTRWYLLDSRMGRMGCLNGPCCASCDRRS